MNCSIAQKLMSLYIDGCVSRRRLAEMNEHVQACAECGAHFASMQRTQSLLGSLGRKVAPPDLALKLRVALSCIATWSQEKPGGKVLTHLKRMQPEHPARRGYTGGSELA